MDGSGMARLGDAIASALFWLSACAIVFVPLGLWKLWDIGVWLYQHVSITWE